jgi:gliding motility-associated-like protein
MNKILLYFLVLFTFFSSSKSFAQGGNTCAAAVTNAITLPYNAAGSICGTTTDDYDNVGASCLGANSINTTGPDRVYYFCATTTGKVNVTLSNFTYYCFDPADVAPFPSLTVWQGCPNAGTCVAGTASQGSPAIATTPECAVEFQVTSGQCYYIMVDNYSGYCPCFDYNMSATYVTVPPTQPGCTNMGFDSGNFSGWTGTYGYTIVDGPTGAATPTYTPAHYTTASPMHAITTGGVDPIGGFPQVFPGGSNSMRLGDGTTPGYGGATLQQTFSVTASNAMLTYSYAVVIQDANSGASAHTALQQPFFKIEVFDCAGNPIICGQYLVVGGPGIPGFILAPGYTDVYYKPWTPVSIDLTPYIGSCATIKFTVGDCSLGGHFAYAYIDAVCAPMAITGNQNICPGTSTTLSAPPGEAAYSWSPGGQTTPSITVSPAVNTSYSCTVTSVSGPSCTTLLTYSVSLYPAVTATSTNQTVCSGTPATITATADHAGGTFAWAPGGQTTPSITVSPTSTTNYTATYTDLNGCKDTALGIVAINPIPTVTVPPSTSYCIGASVPTTNFTSSPAGATYTWTNSNTSIGLAASGTGNVPAFTTTNATSAAISGTITVTPTSAAPASCPGTPSTYTITVNPPPTVVVPANNSYCNGSTIPASAFTSNLVGTTYTWTNSNTTIGLAASGTGNVGSFTATNITTAPVTATITVTPTSAAPASCPGTPASYTITVNPTPTVTVPANNSYCNGGSVPATTFSSNLTGTTFSWTNSNTAIGIPASGTGDISSFTGTNLTSAPVTATITVTPTSAAPASCPGPPSTYTITINPTPTVTVPANNSYCNGATVPATNFTSNVSGATYTWTNSNTTIGLAANGTGNISSFTGTNITAAPITATITVTPTSAAPASCPGTPSTYTITINPTPTVTVPANNSYCNGAAVPATNFSSSVAGSTYVWTNSNTAIGLAASGTGNISSFTGTNTTTASITAIITVTPTSAAPASCPGTPSTYTITINPTPNVTVPANNSYCNGATIPATNFTSNVAGSTFSWTNSNTTIGIPASGTGDISSFTGTNLTSAPITATITVTPTSAAPASCPGTSSTYTITINPTPTVTVPANNSYCNGATVPATNFTSTPPGSTFTWTNSNTAIGLAASGVGNIISFTGTNLTATAITSTITVTPTSAAPASCPGPPSTYTITIDPIPTAPTAAGDTLCPSSSTTLTATAPGGTYEWFSAASGGVLLASGANYTTPSLTTTTTYYVRTTNAAGCVSPFTPVTVTVANNLTVNAGPDQAYCAGGNATLTGTPNGVGYTFSWDAPAASGFSTIYNPAVAPVTTTTYTLTVTDQFGCFGSDQVLVTVNPLPVLVTTDPSPTCSPNTIDITAAAVTAGSTGGGSLTYWPTASATGTQLASPSAINASGTYYIETTTAANCTDIDSVIVVINPLPVSDGGTDLTICTGSSGSIGAASVAGYTYSWSPVTGLNNASISNPTVSLINSTTLPVTTNYTVTTTNSTTLCTSTDVVVVTVNPVATANAGSTQYVCSGSTLTLSGAVGGAATGGTWSGGGGTFSPGNTALNAVYTPTAAEYAADSVILTLTTNDPAGPCSFASSSVTLHFYPKPIVNFTVNDPNGCPTHCAQFTDLSTISGGDNIATWDWNFGDNTADSTVQNPSHCFPITGFYDVTLTATSNHNCVSTFTQVHMVEVYTKPTAEFTPTPNPASVLEPVVTLNNGSSSDVITWNYQFGDGDSISPFTPSPVHTYPSAEPATFTATLIVSNSNGCKDTVSHEVEIGPEFTFYIPNAFTPNGDGVNDYFFGQGIGIEEYDIYIFDRWGNMIYHGDNIYASKWDGRANHGTDPAQQDVYVWKVRLTDVFRKKHTYIGTVTIVR